MARTAATTGSSASLNVTGRCSGWADRVSSSSPARTRRSGRFSPQRTTPKFEPWATSIAAGPQGASRRNYAAFLAPPARFLLCAFGAPRGTSSTRSFRASASFTTVAIVGFAPSPVSSLRTISGHKSNQMIHRYKRAARTHAELNLGPLQPLHDAIPELADVAPSKDAAAE
jgi:hypothetical protein